MEKAVFYQATGEPVNSITFNLTMLGALKRGAEHHLPPLSHHCASRWNTLLVRLIGFTSPTPKNPHPRHPDQLQTITALIICFISFLMPFMTSSSLGYLSLNFIE